MVVYHTLSYANRGFFNNPVTCNDAESPCVAGNYVGNDGFDLYREKPGCSGTRSDNVYMNCTLNQVVDEVHAEKVYRDFFGTRSEDQYWAIMGNFCSKNPKSKYCERAHYLYYTGENNDPSNCNVTNTNCKPGYYIAYDGDDLFVRKPDCKSQDGTFYSGCVLKKVKDTQQAEKIYEDFKNLSLNQEQYNFIMKDYCSMGGNLDYCKDVPTDSIYDNATGSMWLMHLILIAFGIFIGWFWFKDNEDVVSKSNNEDQVSKRIDNEY